MVKQQKVVLKYEQKIKSTKLQQEKKKTKEIKQKSVLKCMDGKK